MAHIHPSRTHSILTLLLSAGGVRALWLAELPSLLFVSASLAVVTLAILHLHSTLQPTIISLHDDNGWTINRGTRGITQAVLLDSGHRRARSIELVFRESRSDGNSRLSRLTVRADSVTDVEFSFLHLQRAFGAHRDTR